MNMNKYAGFMNQIPECIMRKVEKHMCSNVALFKPNTFIVRKLMCSEDFHMIISPEPPPNTYVNGKLHSFDDRRVIAFNPGDTILTTGNGANKSYLAMLIKPELVNRIAEEMGHIGSVRFLKLQNSYSSTLLQTIKTFDKETNRYDSFPMLLDCIAVQIVSLLLREFKTNLKNFPERSPNIDNYINQAIEYIHAFFSANITIDDICSEINVSPFHFIRSFKQKTGISPHQYLLNVRIQKAGEFLSSSCYSVGETAVLCGFVSQSHFSSTFKEKTGCSPAEFKKQPFVIPPQEYNSKSQQIFTGMAKGVYEDLHDIPRKNKP